MKKIDCFVIMPITTPDEMIENKIYEDRNHFKDVYEHIIKTAIEENNWNPIYPKTEGSKIIIGDITGNLLNSEMTVCDISILNPNVFYEAGIRTAIDKPIAYIKDDAIKDIPFDTSLIKHETYRKSLKVNHVKEDIKKLMKHFKKSYEESKGKNPTWDKFGVNIKAELPLASGTTEGAKLDLLNDKITNLEFLLRESLENYREKSWPNVIPDVPISMEDYLLKPYVTLPDQELMKIINNFISQDNNYIDMIDDIHFTKNSIIISINRSKKSDKLIKKLTTLIRGLDKRQIEYKYY